MFRTPSLLACLVTLAGSIVSGFGSAAHADALVIASKAAGIRAGSILKDDTVLDVPAGQSITLLLADNRTRTITGPFNQRIDTFSKGAPSDPSLWNQVTANLREATPKRAPKRAAKKESGPGPVAAMRTAPPEPVSAAAPPVTASGSAAGGRALAFSWQQIPIDGQGDYCVQKGEGLALVRLTSTTAQQAVVVDVRAGTRATIVFGVGKDATFWPAAVPAKTGPYALQLPDGAPRQIRLRVIDPLPAADETLRLLHSQRCQAQIEAWVRGIATASR